MSLAKIGTLCNSVGFTGRRPPWDASPPPAPIPPSGGPETITPSRHLHESHPVPTPAPVSVEDVAPRQSPMSKSPEPGRMDPHRGQIDFRDSVGVYCLGLGPCDPAGEDPRDALTLPWSGRGPD